jgi:hypothetical protein
MSSAPRFRTPIIHDRPSWEESILDHRRALFEAVVREFNAELAAKVGKVDSIRVRLGGKSHGRL